MRVFLGILLSIVGFANVALFVFWLSLVHIAVSGADQKQYIYNNIATDMTILEVILAIIVFAAFLSAVFGYFVLKESVMKSNFRQVDVYLKQKTPAIVKQCLTHTETSAN